MKKLILTLAAVATLVSGTRIATTATYLEYYRDNLFLGLAYHRVGCLTDWNTILSDQDYDGFTTTRYCREGTSPASVPGARWYAYDFISNSEDAARDLVGQCGDATNNRYGTPNYAARSNTCGYNIFTNCNSDCWIRYFSTCVGDRVGTRSPCFGYSYP